jgi:phosphate acetyltransferase
MARSIYLTQTEPHAGKSLIALGLVEELAQHVDRVGVFRPVSDGDQEDHVLDLLLERGGAELTREQVTGVTYRQALEDDALAEILTRFREVEKNCDVVVVLGTDYNNVSTTSELAFNAKVAANLGTPVVLVVSGDRTRSAAEIRQVAEIALTDLQSGFATPIAIVANHCCPDALAEIESELATTGLPSFAIPHDPALAAPSLQLVKDRLLAELIAGDPALLNQDVRQTHLGTTNLKNLLTQVSAGSLIITGGRPEILLGSVMAHAAAELPSLAGVVLTDGFRPAEPVLELLEGPHQRLPVLATSLDAGQVLGIVGSLRSELGRDTQPKVDLALQLFNEHVKPEVITDAAGAAGPGAVTPLMFEYGLLERARNADKHIVLPEGNDERILRAADTLLRRNIARLTILGDAEQIHSRATALGLDLSRAQIIDPAASELLEQFAEEYARLRAHRGITLDEARQTVADASYFGTMMVHLDIADGMVSGATYTTAETIKPSFETIKTEPGISLVSSVFLMCLADRVLVYGDCAVNPNPTVEELVDIAISSAATAAQFEVEPRIAMLSYSTGASGTGADVDKVREVTKLVKERRPDLLVEGPIQYDAAVDPSVAQTKLPDSDVAGQATVFIFPDLNAGNNTYKAVQRSAGAVAIGPILQGLNKPVNDLSRGALIPDIINTVAITAVQAEAKAAAKDQLPT